MSLSYSWVAGYSFLVLLISMLGGYMPFLGRVSHGRLQLYLSVSAGVMLGASFFHVMPEAFRLSGELFGWWMSLGVVGLFCIERFIAPHSHEMDGGKHAHHDHGHAADHADHNHDHGHNHNHAKDQRAAAPAVAGWMAVVGLTIHTFMNGVGLASLVKVSLEEHAKNSAQTNMLGLFLPGISMFLAIFLHKPADALAISTVLSRKGVPSARIVLVQLGFALMVPIGAVAFFVTEGSIEDSLKSQLTGAALAFSAGTFLFIALSDLLPEVQFHRHDRLRLFLALVTGVALMGLIALLEGDEHAEDEHKEKPASAQAEDSHKESDKHGNVHGREH
jgi:zinc and cadmium transporter